MPKISITIPAYNNVESFLRTFNSVLMQKYDDYEIVITDDSTNDDIKKVIEETKNNKIKYFKNEITLGVAENWNKGLKLASGEYIKILHHDDWFISDNALEKFVNIMDKTPESLLGYSKSVNVDIETGKKKHRHAEKYVKKIEKNIFDLINNNRIGAPSVTVFKNGTNIYFDKNLRWLIDVDFYISLLIKNNKIAFINEELINIGIQKNRLTDECLYNKSLEQKEILYLKDKYKEFYK